MKELTRCVHCGAENEKRNHYCLICGKQIAGAPSPKKAALLTLFLGPGAGQIYNEQYVKGAIFLTFFLVALGWTLKIVFAAYFMYYDRIAMGDLTAISLILDKISAERVAWFFNTATLLWIYSIFEAYFVARRRRDSVLAGAKLSSGEREDVTKRWSAK
jgi:TM2 domain-containing membrane protein YozV